MGEITDIRVSSSENGSTYLPTVEFEFEGETYSFESNAGSGNASTYKRWSEVEVRVNPDNPDHAKINTIWEVWAASIVVGSFTVLVWLTYIAVIWDIYRKVRFRKNMKESGIPVTTVITEIHEEIIKAKNSGVTARRKVWRAHTKGVVNGDERTFKSDRIPKNPMLFSLQPGVELTVYVHPKKPKKYYMDFTVIPGMEDLM